MSNVLKALDLSEQSHQATQQGGVYPNSLNLPQEVKTSKSAIVALVCLPALLTAAYGIYESYQDKVSSRGNDNQPQVIQVDTPFEYAELPYPEFTNLTPTYDVQVAEVINVPEPVREMSSPSFDKTEVTPDISETLKQEESLLGNLDLSELSPELAMRIENALGDETDLEAPSSSQVSNLAQQGDKWQGRLPALNFQTHVYSSNKTKRWVKVNGTEYNQGDWITDRIQLERIEQNSCLIRFDGESIEVPALYDWQG